MRLFAFQILVFAFTLVCAIESIRWDLITHKAVQESIQRNIESIEMYRRAQALAESCTGESINVLAELGRSR